jgi:hypothetical protein
LILKWTPALTGLGLKNHFTSRRQRSYGLPFDSVEAKKRDNLAGAGQLLAYIAMVQANRKGVSASCAHGQPFVIIASNTVALTGEKHAHLTAAWLDKTDANVK